MHRTGHLRGALLTRCVTHVKREFSEPASGEPPGPQRPPIGRPKKNDAPVGFSNRAE